MLVQFERGIQPKVSLNIGMLPKLRQLLEEYKDLSECDINDVNEIWKFLLLIEENNFFSWLVSFHKKKWINGKIIDISENNNDLLWESIEKENVRAVKSILTIPNLFKKEHSKRMKEYYEKKKALIN